jgi:hypothetical protein
LPGVFASKTDLALQPVNCGERETMEIEPAVVTPDFAPAFWFGHNAPHRAREFSGLIPARNAQKKVLLEVAFCAPSQETPVQI